MKGTRRSLSSLASCLLIQCLRAIPSILGLRGDRYLCSWSVVRGSYCFNSYFPIRLIVTKQSLRLFFLCCTLLLLLSSSCTSDAALHRRILEQASSSSTHATKEVIWRSGQASCSPSSASKAPFRVNCLPYTYLLSQRSLCQGYTLADASSCNTFSVVIKMCWTAVGSHLESVD